jgi:hypothetical protein
MKNTYVHALMFTLICAVSGHGLFGNTWKAIFPGIMAASLSMFLITLHKNNGKS